MTFDINNKKIKFSNGKGLKYNKATHPVNL